MTTILNPTRKVEDQGEAVPETFCKDPSEYNWAGGASYVAEALLTGKPTLITPEHGLHVLEVMNACHQSQRTGRPVSVEITFPWPIPVGTTTERTGGQETGLREDENSF